MGQFQQVFLGTARINGVMNWFVLSIYLVPGVRPSVYWVSAKVVNAKLQHASVCSEHTQPSISVIQVNCFFCCVLLGQRPDSVTIFDDVCLIKLQTCNMSTLSARDRNSVLGTARRTLTYRCPLCCSGVRSTYVGVAVAIIKTSQISSKESRQIRRVSLQQWWWQIITKCRAAWSVWFSVRSKKKMRAHAHIQ